MTGLIRRAFGKFNDPPAPIAEECDEGLPLSRLPDRRIVSVFGTVTNVKINPIGGVYAVEAELDDGSDTVTLVWLGRRHIAGIHPNTRLSVRGRIARRDGRRVLFNPNYVLQP